MNILFLLLVMVAFGATAYQQIFTPQTVDNPIMQQLAQSMITAANDAVTLSIGLIGVMALFLGLMKVAENGGLLKIIAKLLQPLLTRLFPEIPPEHPAMGAMVLNLSANALGLANAATPFGIKAMTELNELNAKPGTATNAMILFLAINTSSVTLLPTGVIALRAAAGSTDPAGIIPTTLFATLFSTTMAIIIAKFMQRFSHDCSKKPEALAGTAEPAYPLWVSICALLALFAFIPLTITYGTLISPWVIPTLAVLLLGFGFVRKVKIYEAFVEGAKDGFNVAIKIVPYLVAILTAVAMFRASGALDFVVNFLGHYTNKIHLPAEALPMALLRPLSGSGAFGILAATIQDPAIGPDSYIGYLVSTFQGSTETTFYVLAVYFGAVQIQRLRHAVITALCADLTGILAAVFIVHRLYG